MHVGTCFVVNKVQSIISKLSKWIIKFILIIKLIFGKNIKTILTIFEIPVCNNNNPIKIEPIYIIFTIFCPVSTFSTNETKKKQNPKIFIINKKYIRKL